MRGRYLALLMVALGATPAAADVVHVPYRATLAGIGVATGALTVDASGDGYRLSLDAIAAGGGKVVRAKAHASGRRARNGLWPDFYSADFDHAGQKQRVALGFAGGALALVAVLPPGPKGSGQTQPPRNQSMGLIDPLTALALPAPPAHLAPLSACGRTHRIFEGTQRYELRLFPSRSEIVTVAGSPVPALACRAELRRGTAATAPRNPRGLERWPESGRQNALVWLAGVAGGRLLVPARIEGNFGFGALSVEATDAGPFNAARLTAAR